MSFQAYLDAIHAKTGKTPEDFRALATAKGLLRPGVATTEIVTWLGEEFGLGRGHAMALVAALGQTKDAGLNPDEKIQKQFSGAKQKWAGTYEALLELLSENGPISTAPTNSYISLLKGTKKFAIVQVTSDRIDLGIKLASAPVTDRFEASGAWNSMVTHRTRLTEPVESVGGFDPELLDWLQRAYDAA